MNILELTETVAGFIRAGWMTPDEAADFILEVSPYPLSKFSAIAFLNRCLKAQK